MNQATIHQNIPEKHPNTENESVLLHPTLDYINRILLEEDIDEHFGGYQEVAAAISSIEKPFYDALGEKYPPSPSNQLALVQFQSNSNHHPGTAIADIQINTSSSDTVLREDSRVETFLALEFQRGVEEGMKFLPTVNNSVIDMRVSRLSLDITHNKNKRSPETTESEEGNAHGLVVRHKNRNSSGDPVDLDLSEGRKSKMVTLYTDEPTRDEMFDKVLLYHGEEYARKEASRLHEMMKYKAKYPSKNELEIQADNLNLNSVLIQCSQAVANNDREMAEELIKEIRKQASPFGSGAQRLAHILTDGLEARLAGTGRETYRQLVRRPISIREMLKAYQVHITVCPFHRISYGFANDYICKVAENASKIHVIDFGITFGFQWPPLIQALAKRKGSAPKLRITGVNEPQPGFRPAERIRKIGVRLEEYAKSFNVPFEYQYIASSWESIHVEDCKIDSEEVLVVNSMFRFRQVSGDISSISMDSPRNQVLSLIRQMKPKVFILGTMNLSIGAFFTTRFRNVLSHYSMIFDMFEMLVPRDDEGRWLMERELMAHHIINLVACEGHDWVERPETYKQWHKRISLAGFKQVALDHDIFSDCNEKMRNGYHKDFFMVEESDWLLQGWRGRVNVALSMWEPN